MASNEAHGSAPAQPPGAGATVTGSDAPCGSATDACDVLEVPGLLHAVLSELRSPGDLAAAAATCRRWRGAVTDALWQHAYVSVFGTPEPEELLGSYRNQHRRALQLRKLSPQEGSVQLMGEHACVLAVAYDAETGQLVVVRALEQRGGPQGPLVNTQLVQALALRSPTATASYASSSRNGQAATSCRGGGASVWGQPELWADLDARPAAPHAPHALAVLSAHSGRAALYGGVSDSSGAPAGIDVYDLRAHAKIGRFDTGGGDALALSVHGWLCAAVVSDGASPALKLWDLRRMRAVGQPVPLRLAPGKSPEPAAWQARLATTRNPSSQCCCSGCGSGCSGRGGCCSGCGGGCSGRGACCSGCSGGGSCSAMLVAVINYSNAGPHVAVLRVASSDGGAAGYQHLESLFVFNPTSLCFSRGWLHVAGHELAAPLGGAAGQRWHSPGARAPGMRVVAHVHVFDSTSWQDVDQIAVTLCDT